MVDKKILERLNELIALGEEVKGTRFSRSSPGVLYFGDDGVSGEKSNQWGVSCLNFLGRVFGNDSPYYTKFDELYPNFNDYSPTVKALGIMRAAREDIEKGALFTVRRLIEAEVFDEFLDQAQSLVDPFD